MFSVLLHVEDYGACDLHFGQQIEITQNEEHLALTDVLLSHVLLIGDQVIILVRIPSLLHLVLITLHHFISLVLPISQWEDLKICLDHGHWEVEVC